MHLLDYVNIKQGTASTSRFSHGNTLPLTQLPFGMAAFAPQTNWNPNFYHPADRSLEGVRLTHQPSPWVGDFGCFLMIPQSGDPFSRQHAIWSGYRPSDAVLTPVYQKLRFLRARADFELTPAQRGAFIRLSFDSSVQIPRLTLRPMDAYTKLALNPETRRLEGYTTYHRHPAADSFALYFVMEFDGDLDLENTAATFNDGRVAPGQGNEGDGAGLSIAFASREIQIRLAVSYISIAQAAENLKQELEGCSFEEIHSKGAAEWETWLSKIRVLETDEADLKTFYTCMYRLFLFPNKMHEISATGETIHYSPYDGKIHPGVLYTNNGFWDTFRTVYPLYSILCPGMYEEILEGFVNAYRESGWLPKWPSPAETGIMPGTLIDAIIADAAVKGIGSRELLETALEGALKHSVTPGEKSQVGRRGVEEYVKLGYVPKDQYRENVNRSLDYIYGDFCIAQTAKVLGKDAIAADYMVKSKN